MSARIGIGTMYLKYVEIEVKARLLKIYKPWCSYHGYMLKNEAG